MAGRCSIFSCVVGVLAGGALMCALEAQPPSAAAARGSSTSHRDVINRYCISCHNDRLKTGGLTLDQVAAQEIGRNPEAWEKVVRKLRVRQMPPVGMPRP